MKLKKTHRLHSSDQRLYQLSVPVIGLTGGIASGKTTVSRLLSERGFAIINADHLVKDVYSLPETQAFVLKRFPDVIENGVISFPLLRKKVFTDKKVKNEIENFIYQRLPDAFKSAFDKLNKPDVVIYDIPLLFEKNMQDFFDVNVLVYAPRSTQLARLMSRDGLSEELAETILKQQMDMEEKKDKAQYIIDNSRTEALLQLEIDHFLREISDS